MSKTVSEEKNNIMKRMFVISLTVLFLLFSLSSIISKADVFVSPAEISISIEDDFIDGNTSKKITVTNRYSHNISVKAWMIHPDITEWMRQNRTFIENLSWITIEPSQRVIPANSSAKFYIHLAIPNETKNQTYDKHWEIWAALKMGDASGSNTAIFGEGYLVRVYVDAPSMPEEPSSSLDQIFYDTLLAIGVALILTVIFFFFRERKKRRNE